MFCRWSLYIFQTTGLTDVAFLFTIIAEVIYENLRFYSAMYCICTPLLTILFSLYRTIRSPIHCYSLFFTLSTLPLHYCASFILPPSSFHFSVFPPYILSFLIVFVSLYPPLSNPLSIPFSVHMEIFSCWWIGRSLTPTNYATIQIP